MRDPAVSAFALGASLIWVHRWAPLESLIIDRTAVQLRKRIFVFEDVLGIDRMDPFHAIDKS